MYRCGVKLRPAQITAMAHRGAGFFILLTQFLYHRLNSYHPAILSCVRRWLSGGSYCTYVVTILFGHCPPVRLHRPHCCIYIIVVAYVRYNMVEKMKRGEGSYDSICHLQ